MTILRTSAYYRQHETFTRMAMELLASTQQPFSPDGLRHVRVLLARFKGAMLVHARMENEALYPFLMEHPDPEIAARARSLYNELGEMYDDFIEFDHRYGQVESDGRSVSEYYASIRRLLKRLKRRMQREDNELYPLVERAEAAGVHCYANESAFDPDKMSSSEERERWEVRARALRERAGEAYER